MRLGAAFITLCMLVIAVALAAVSYLSLGFSPVEAGATGLALLAMLAVANAFSADRGPASLDTARQIGALSQGMTDLARQVKDLGRRVTELEAGAERAPAGANESGAAAALAGEIEVLGSLVNQIAKTVAAHESALLDVLTAPPPAAVAPARPAPLPQSAPAPAPPPIMAPPAEPKPAAGGAFAPVPAAAIAVREALTANRLDLHLQPIVSLPQRKIRFYEGFARLRTDTGETLAPADFLPAARHGGLVPLLDGTVLFRAAQVAQRLVARNRETSLFCNVAGETLRDAGALADMLGFLEANPEAAQSLVLEFTQATLRDGGAAENAALARLAALGCRLSVDHVEDLRIDAQRLFERGVRFVKIPAAALLEDAAGDIHATDLARLLARNGIDLIVEKIETEAAVADLLDYDIRFGQGYLFAAPRPVRNDVFETPPASAETSPLPVAAAAAPPAGEPAEPKAEPLRPPARRRERDLDTAPATAARTQTALAQLAREMMRRA